MKLYLVLFACYPSDEPKYFLLDEEKYDTWCIVEPPQGYKVFKTIWSGEIEQILIKPYSDGKLHD